MTLDLLLSQSEAIQVTMNFCECDTALALEVTMEGTRQTHPDDSFLEGVWPFAAGDWLGDTPKHEHDGNGAL